MLSFSRFASGSVSLNDSWAVMSDCAGKEATPRDQDMEETQAFTKSCADCICAFAKNGTVGDCFFFVRPKFFLND